MSGRRETIAVLAVAVTIGRSSYSFFGPHNKYQHAPDAMCAAPAASLGEPSSRKDYSFRKRVKAGYESRLRLGATPEKVFDYFASLRDDATGQLFMTKEEFFNSLLPNTSLFWKDDEEEKESRNNFSSLIFRCADADGDGRISFPEFLLFTTLFAFDKASLLAAFKLHRIQGESKNDNSSLFVNKEGFVSMIAAVMNAAPIGGRYSSVKLGDSFTLLDGRSVACNKTPEEVVGAALQGGLGMELFQGSEDRLSWEKFWGLTAALKEELLFAEFARCGHTLSDNPDVATLKQFDFAKLFIGFIGVSEQDALVRRILSIDFLEDSDRIPFRQFQAFDETLKDWTSLRYAVLFQDKSGKITRQTLIKALGVVCREDLDFNPLVEVVFRVFDKDNNGILEPSEFLSLIKKRKMGSALSIETPRDRWNNLIDALRDFIR